MPAGKLNYVIAYKNHSQLFGTTSKEIALSSPPPPGWDIEDKQVWFITCPPDTNTVTVFKVPQEEILSAELKEHKKKKKDDEQEKDDS